MELLVQPSMRLHERLIKKKGNVLEFIRINHNPDHTFPNGIPNPMLKKNRQQITDSIVESNANLGIAFDGDFDRCFSLMRKVGSWKVNILQVF